MKTILHFFLLAIFLGGPLVSFAQPSNDGPCDAIALELNALPYLLDNAGATIGPNEVVPPFAIGQDPCLESWCNGDPNAQNSTWFSFIAPSNGAVEITTCLTNTAIDTQLALWQAGDCADFSTFTFIAANDDVEGGCGDANVYASTLSIDGLIDGQLYYVQIDGTNAAEGEFEIQVLDGVPTSKINFIHNSADMMVEVVDLRINGELVADDFTFRTCTGFIEVVANEVVTITINPDNSVDDSEAMYTITQTFDGNQDYLATLHGILSASGYSPAPPLTISFFEGAQNIGQNPGTLPLIFFHGSTDAPVVDIYNLESSTLINDDLAYGNYSAEGYTDIPAANFSITLMDENGVPLDLSFCAPLAATGEFGIALTIVASGFLNPENNSNGAEFGLYAVNQFDGNFLQLESGACQFPSNDEICSATNLIVNDPPATFNNALATVQENESSPYNLPSSDPESDCQSQWCDGSLDATLWFTFIAPASGNVMVSTCFEATSFDTQIALVQVGDCNDFSNVTYLASNDDKTGGCTDGDNFASTLYYTGLTEGNTYYVQVDGWQGESGPFQIQVLDAVSVTDHVGSSLVVYPNPAKDQLTISGLRSMSHLEIRDITGQLYFSSSNFTNGTIDTSSLSAGAYMLSIRQHDMLESKLIIIE